MFIPRELQHCGGKHFKFISSSSMSMTRITSIIRSISICVHIGVYIYIVYQFVNNWNKSRHRTFNAVILVHKAENIMHLKNVPALDSIFLMGKWGPGSSTMSVFLQSHWAWTKCYSHCLWSIWFWWQKKWCISKRAVVFNLSHSWVNVAFVRKCYVVSRGVEGKKSTIFLKVPLVMSQA